VRGELDHEVKQQAGSEIQGWSPKLLRDKIGDVEDLIRAGPALGGSRQTILWGAKDFGGWTLRLAATLDLVRGAGNLRHYPVGLLVHDLKLTRPERSELFNSRLRGV
jgi:hypothetical protein